MKIKQHCQIITIIITRLIKVNNTIWKICIQDLRKPLCFHGQKSMCLQNKLHSICVAECTWFAWHITSVIISLAPKTLTVDSWSQIRLTFILIPFWNTFWRKSYLTRISRIPTRTTRQFLFTLLFSHCSTLYLFIHQKPFNTFRNIFYHSS